MNASILAPTLEVDVSAIARNYRLLCGRLKSGRCAAVVKADAYGLGVTEVAPALYDAGCRDFFVATLEEGVRLRKVLAECDPPALELWASVPQLPTIYVFHGARKGETRDFTGHGLIPVLSSFDQIGHWDDAGPCALHIDTGMNRLGLTLEEVGIIPLPTYHLQLVMSHLACAGEPEHPLNKQQLDDFSRTLTRFNGIPASFANSSGIFLGADYHFDLARPGCSLYGISPNTSQPNPMENVVTLSAPILQYRRIKKAQSVGYGATKKAKAGSILATVEMGYADGFLRSSSNKAHGFVAGVKVPLIGRVSMDMIIFDISKVPEELYTSDLRVTLMGSELPVDEVAEAAGTIGYEIFTRMGSRVKRVYL